MLGKWASRQRNLPKFLLEGTAWRLSLSLFDWFFSRASIVFVRLSRMRKLMRPAQANLKVPVFPLQICRMKRWMKSWGQSRMQQLGDLPQVVLLESHKWIPLWSLQYLEWRFPTWVFKNLQLNDPLCFHEACLGMGFETTRTPEELCRQFSSNWALLRYYPCGPCFWISTRSRPARQSGCSVLWKRHRLWRCAAGVRTCTNVQTGWSSLGNSPKWLGESFSRNCSASPRSESRLAPKQATIFHHFSIMCLPCSVFPFPSLIL